MLRISIKIMLTGVLAVSWWASLFIASALANMPSELGIAAAIVVVAAATFTAIGLITKIWKAEAKQCADYLSSLD